MSFADFHGETVSALAELSGYCDLLSAKIEVPISGFKYETISGNQDLSVIYDKNCTSADLTPENTLCALRYVFQTLGNWKFVQDQEIVASMSGSSQYIRLV